MNQQSISQIDGVRPLTVDEGKLLLNRFGLAPEPCTPDYLQRLQWCFLCDSSFHNLELLAGESPRTAEAAIEAVMAGRGGPCHVQVGDTLQAQVRVIGQCLHVVVGDVSTADDSDLQVWLSIYQRRAAAFVRS